MIRTLYQILTAISKAKMVSFIEKAEETLTIIS